MNPLPATVSHPELCAAIVGEFAFMKAMSRPEDSSFQPLQELSLDKVFNEADTFFIEFTTLEEIIDTQQSDLAVQLAAFLYAYIDVTDIIAIQQNIHNKLK